MRRATVLIIPVTVATALLVSCSDRMGPHVPVDGQLSLAPSYASEAAGLVPVASGRFVVTRVADQAAVTDIVVDIAPDADSVDLTLTVPVLDPSDEFLLSIALASPAADTVFRAGPVPVQPTTSGAPTPIPVVLEYTGVGFDAAAVRITSDITWMYGGDSLFLAAEALDSAGAPIAGTPIEWRSLDTARVAVPDRAIGRVVGGGQRGTARIVARLLTGQADTVSLTLRLPPAAIAADSGSGQVGPAGEELPNALVARVTASDGVAIADEWVRFAVTLGGGSLTADSALTDANGRARVGWTLGNVVGTQTVTATTWRLSGASAVFTATSQATGAGAIAIVAGNEQSALVGTAVAVAPQVRVTDTQGNPVPNVTVSFAVTQGDGTLTAATPTTDANGLASVGSWTVGPAVGLNTITATVDGLTPVQFVALGTGSGGATSMQISAGNGQTALAQTPVAIAPAVLLTDTAGAPVAGATVAFTVTAGDGALTGDTATSDAEGIATVGSWTLGAPGVNELTASAVGLPDVLFQATAIVGPPDTVIVVSGNGQSAEAGTSLPEALVVAVLDSAGNPIPDVAVEWGTLDGTISPATGITDAAGRAQATWTLGVNAITQTATATASGLTPAVFTATATFPNPSILLALQQGADRIRLADSALMDVTLTAPAGVDGVVLNFAVDDPSVVGLDTTDLSIPPNGTTTQLWLYGVAQGTTTVRATAAGYADGALSVLVTVQVLSMPTALNVPFGSTASLPLQISAPAGSGGVTVTLVSDNPAAVGVATPTVTIPEGQQTANATLSGVAPGAATVTGATVDFGVAQTAAATRANLNIVESASTFPQTFADTLTVRLESDGSPIAAPSPGIPVTLTARNPDCVAATSPITIPTGLVSAIAVATHAGIIEPPCSSYLVAESPAIEPDSILVTVNQAPTITAPAYTLGAGLQLSGNAYGDLGVTNHGGVDVVIASANTAIALVAPNQSTVGSEALTLTVPNGERYFYYNLQALEGVADTGVAQVQLTFTAPGFTPGSQTLTVRRPVFDLYYLPPTTTTFSPDAVFHAYIGYTLPNYTYIYQQQPIRPGGQPVTVTLVNDSAGVGQLTTTALTGDTVTVVIPVGASTSPTTVAQGGVAYSPDNPGITTISASTSPAFDQLFYYNRQITVSAPTITSSAYTLGAGLQLGSNGYGDLGATNHGGVDVVIASADPTIALVAPDQNTVGGEADTVTVPDGQRYFYYNLQALEGVADTGVAQVQLTFSAPGFTPGSQMLTVRRPVFDLYPIPANTTTFSPDAAFYAYLGYTLPNTPYVYQQQPIRAGGQPVTVTLVNDSVGVGQLTTTALTGDTVTVVIPVGQSNSPTTVAQGGVAYSPDNPGITTISASTSPAFDQLFYYNRQISVSAPTITAPAYTLGAGLQLNGNGYGDLGATNHGGVDVVIASADPTIALIAPDQNTVGGETDTVTVPDGQRYFYYNLQALEGVADTGVAQVQLTFAAPGFTAGSQTLTVRRPVFDLYPIPTNLTTFSPDAAFYAYIGYTLPNTPYVYEQQPIRAGGQPVTVTVANASLAVGDLVTTARTGDTVSVVIPVGSSNSPTTVAQGGVAFRPVVAGSTTISGSIPSFDELTYQNRAITVSAPAIALYESTVGSGLQKQIYGRLNAADHGGVYVTVESSAEAVAVLAPDQNTAGSRSLTLSVPDGQQYFYYYVQGTEGQTGTVSTTASAIGFTNGTAPVNVVQPAVGIYGLPANVQAGADSVAFYAQIGIPDASNQYLSEAQAVRAGSAALAVSLASSDASVGQLLTSTQSGGNVSVQIPSGTFRSPLTVAAGGAAFKPLAAGTTVVTSTIDGFITTLLYGRRSVTVTP